MIEKAVPQGGGFPLPVPALLCQVAAAAAPAQGWEEGPAGLARCQSSRWEKQFTEGALWEQCKNSVRHQQLASPLYLIICLLLSSGGVKLNLQIDHKDARWVNGAVLPADSKLCPKP